MRGSRSAELRRQQKRLLLLALDWTRPKDPPMSLGQASILAKLRQDNISVLHRSWAVNQKNFKLDAVLQYVMSNADSDVDLALGAYVWHEPETQALLSAVREAGFPGRIILGGPQVSYTSSGLEQYYPQADVFIRGYGESALAQLLLSDVSRPPIAGIHYAGEPDLGLSANVDIDNLPSPYLTGVIKPQRFIRWETQRGCPFRCAFCQHRESDITMKRRQFKYSRIMQEIHWILNNPVIQDIAVLDPTFNSGPYYMDVLHALIAGNYTGKLALQCRIEMVREDFLDAVQTLNKTARVVLEFGLQTIHREEAKLIQRPNNMRKVSRILLETNARNIATEVSLIFGLPGQTVQSFQDSIKFCKDHGVPTIYAYPLMLLRGTPLHADRVSLGLVESSDINVAVDRIQANIPHVVSSPSFTYSDWCRMVEIAETLDRYNAATISSDISSRRAHENATVFWDAPEAAKVYVLEPGAGG